MRIGEVAEKTGVPTKTIRYYEHVGLLPPPPRTAAGYRDYDERTGARLGFIRAAQSVGLSLGEIREVLAFRDRGETPCAHVRTLIERHATNLSERIAALEAMRRDLNRLVRRARASSPANGKHAEFCHIIEDGERTLAKAPREPSR